MSSPPTSQPSAFAGGAVFVSYASQDAAAANRLCDALRAAGLEVWFDQNELGGGDAWDRKIRAQIGGCALFVPVVSAATQARREGYFRLEWKLADERTHLMAEGTPFILPVVIDETKDREALVPKSFLDVQWTRLPGGEAGAAFGARAKKLLGGTELETGRPRPVERGEGAPSPASQSASSSRVGRRVPAAAWVGALAVIAIGAGATFFATRKSEPTAAAVPNAGAGTRPPTAEKSAATTSTLPPSTSALAAEKSVAVLAFQNLSDDKDNEYFSDGISEELLNVLGRVPGLRVAAPMSAFSFKGKNVSAQEIGQKLNVAYLVNGSVRRAGPAIRVVARLSRADTDEQIWTEKFDGEAKNVFALQDEIAGKIAAALSLKLGAAARVAKPIDPEAYRLYLEGRHLWSLRTLDALDGAEAVFRQALQLESESALIHAGLAELYATRALYRALMVLPEAGDLGRAAEMADRAIALDPKLSQGYVARATIALARSDYAGAERLLRESLALAPNDALALNRLGDAMIHAGRLDAALENYQRALQLDPLSVFMVRDVVRQSSYAHRFQEAVEVAKRFEAAAPRDARLSVGHFHAQIQLGMVEQAVTELKALLPTITVRENFIGPSAVELVFFLREAKLEAESEALAMQLLSRFGPDTYLHAMVLMARGRREEALPLLKPFAPGSQDRLYWSPIFDPVREDPRFLRKIEEFPDAAEYKVARATLARMLKEQAGKK